MDISLLKPYAKNAKQHSAEQIAQIAKSITEFGFNQPIVVDADNVIIVGHGRYEAAKSLGMADVPVQQVSLTPAKTKAYRLADNKLNESEWSMDLVMEELQALRLEDYDISLTGFDLDAVAPSTVIEVDHDTVEQDYQTYLTNSIKQIVLYFKDEDYASTLERLTGASEELGSDNNTDTFLKLLDFYENHSSTQATD